MFPGAVERRNCIDRCAYASSTTLYPSHGHPRNFDIFDILGSCTVCTDIPLIYIYMKGGNPKWRIWDDVVTYCDLESFIEIYIHYTIGLSTYNIFQFECVYINLPLNLPMSGHRPKFSLLDFRPSYTNININIHTLT